MTTKPENPAAFKPGAVYKICHSRKGTFSLLVSGEDEEWLHGFVYEGVASAMLDYNVKREGENITVRKCFILKSEKQPLAAREATHD